MQGESDANERDAPGYAPGLTAMTAALRYDLGAGHMTALYSLNTRNSMGRNRYIPSIVEAQKDAAARDPLAVYVDASAASTANDAHWDSAGTLAVGRWLAEAMWKLEAAAGVGGK